MRAAVRPVRVADPEAVRIEKPLNGVFKHPGDFRLKNIQLTGVQNLLKLFFVVCQSVRVRGPYGRTDVSITPFFLPLFFITWRRIRRFWSRGFRRS